jgi:endoglucanase
LTAGAQNADVISMRMVILFFLASIVSFSSIASTSSAKQNPTMQDANRAIGRGVNYGNVLDADPPQGWDAKLDLADFDRIAKAGFNSVRIPVRWERNTSSKPPNEIEKSFFDLVDSAVNSALKSGLVVILNIHHDLSLNKNPETEKPRFLAMWSQIAAHYKTYSPRLYFEILNEPHDRLIADLWNSIYPEALKIIRKENPERPVIVEGAQWGSLDAMLTLSPSTGADSHLIYSFHYYSPYNFTHQGAPWVNSEAVKNSSGLKWSGSEPEVAAMEKDFERASEFASRHKVPVFIGEFGAYKVADHDSRVRWTTNVTRLAKKYGFSTSYWEFKSGFGVYNAKNSIWDTRLRDAALGK